jgi:hypothetical protein
MNASVVDLRYKMNEVLSALDRREQVTILYHGKVKGTIIPAGEVRPVKVADHPFFGMADNDALPVDEVLQNLRGGRFNDL